MARILVTGATGFLGTHLLPLLDPKDVRVLVRGSHPSSDIEVDVEISEGSILDEGALARALEGVEQVYHLAGKVSRNPDDVRELYQVHVEGTTLLCRAAKASGVKRIVLASTSGTIAVSDDSETVADESAPPPLELIGGWPYYTSKLYQEEAAKRECEGGPDVVTLNPSLLLGPGDKRLSSTEDVLRFLSRDVPVIPPGGVNFVDVRDVAAAFVSAMDKGRGGERYLLGGPNWTFKTFFERLERISKVKGPKVSLPESMYSIAGMAFDALYRQLDKAPPVDRVSSEMGQRFWYLDASKAQRELDFDARDPYETLHETVAYIQQEILGETAVR